MIAGRSVDCCGDLLARVVTSRSDLIAVKLPKFEALASHGAVL